MELSWERVSWALREPLVTSWGAIAERSVLRVALDGEGFGEAAPLPGYDPIGIDDVELALAAYARALAALDADAGGGAILDACRAVADVPWALAAVDLALWDRAGRRAGRPVVELIAGVGAFAPVLVNATIGGVDPVEARAATVAAVADGFGAVKIKVGVGDDLGRVAAVRAAAPAIAICVDANGAWTVSEAIASLTALSAFGIALAEEPVHGVEELRAVRAAVSVPIAADETGGAAGAVDAVCLKVGRCGGISATLAAAVAARAAGAEVYLASAFDGPLGVAAAVHVAAALEVARPCGLATLGAFSAPVPAVLAPAGGMIAVPRGPGLGV